MSNVTDIVVIAHCGIKEEIRPLLAAMEDHLNNNQVFSQIDEHCGGRKCLQLDVWACAANYANYHELIDTLKAFLFDSELDEELITVIVQLENGGVYHFIKSPGTVQFSVTHFGEA